jgi:putative acetyltransferase
MRATPAEGCGECAAGRRRAALPPGIALREERAETDAAGVRALLLAAFGGPDEADLVEALRAEEGAVVAALLAVDEAAAGTVVGHVLFSRVAGLTAGGAAVPAVALAPLAVAPAWQRRGIGAALVRRGLALCRRRGAALALVLGDPDWYGRLGFSAAAARGIGGVPWAGHPAFAARALRPRMGDAGGRARYACAFGRFG